MRIDTTTSEQLTRYLDLTTSALKLTAENMANVDTPGYRAVGMDFEGEMREAMAGTARSVQVKFEDGLVARPDGNNVSLDRESVNLAEAQLRFRTGVTLLRQQYQRVMDAIHAESK